MFDRREFPSGLQLVPHKAAALERAIFEAPAPTLATVALEQGNGREARPTVSAGDRVRVGTLIGRAMDEGTVAVHASIAGIVRAIEVRETASRAGQGLCIVIENDGSDQNEPGLEMVEWDSLSPEMLVDRIRAAGIAGLGGAAFPTAAKLAAASRRPATHLVLNGAECEPWICCDDALMRERAADVVLGGQVMLRASGAARCTIAVEDDKPEAIAALESALAAAADPRLELRLLGATYPAGAERQLLAVVTGTEIPHDAYPTDVGLLCQNVGTAAAVASLVRTGMPATRRVVTVTGSGVGRPGNVEARYGTPIADLVAACGGYRSDPRRLIAGGSMTGRALPCDAVPVTQAVNCIIAATAEDLSPPRREMPCIRCGDCAGVCPAGLLPQSLLRAAGADDAELLETFGLADCIECGCCDYVCPSQIPLTARFRSARAARALRLDEQRRAAEARERYARHERRLAEAAAAEREAFEAARRRARGGPE
ncbi:MAG: electron transport complex subunit RsxC [Gammaproteobacteria bacterium]|nr:electron transport complex subunit RsxC [Gammaproteobacteria bacterium]